MKNVLITIGALIALAACGGQKLSGKEAIIDGCEKAGESPEICNCIGGVLESHLSTQTLDKVAKTVEKEGKSPADQIESLNPDQLKEFIAASPGLNLCAAMATE